MGDMGDLFRDWEVDKKDRREARLDDAKAATDLVGWTVHTEYHWSRTVAGERLNWWPSTGKWSHGLTRSRKPKMYFGTRVDLLNFIRNREPTENNG